jgi:tetratricopeptide (TPR) repeat protein
MVLSDARTRTPKLVSSVPDARAFRLSATEGFLLSCVDGLTSEGDLALVTGRGLDEVRGSLSKLETLGLITIEEKLLPPRASPFPRHTPGATATPGAMATDGTRPARSPMTGSAVMLTPLPPRGVADNAAAMAEQVDIDPKLRIDLLSLHAALDRLDHYTLLGIDRGADKHATKRAYYELAAKFHPDRYFRKRLGTFKIRMEAVFSRLTLALETLGVPEKRAEYDAYLDEQLRLRGIETVLADAAAEVRRAQESVERAARAEELTPLAPPVAPRPSIALLPDPRPARVQSSPEIDPALRRETFARRLLGGRASSPSIPPAPRPSTPPTPTTAEAMGSLRRRYEDRVAAARSVEARKYAARGEEAVRTNQVAKAASAFEVAHGLAPHDDDLKRKATAARAQADSVLGQTYRGQAEYEEKNGQWADAARSWAGACKARPNDTVAHQRAASATLKVGADLSGALRFAQHACSLDPTSVSSRVTLGEIYLTTGQGADARRELETAASLAPHDDTITQMLKKARKLA